MAQWKGRIPAGRTLHQPVISLDILPTTLAAAGLGPSTKELDGVNLLPLLTGATHRAPHEKLFWRYDRAIAIRRGDWKLVRQPAGPKAQDPAFEPYNLASDIAETRNLASAEPARVAKMRAELDALNAQMAAPLW